MKEDKYRRTWRKVRLGDVVELIAGFAFKGNNFSSTIGEKVIKITDIKPPYIDYKGAHFIDTTNYDSQKLSKYLVRNKDFVIAMTGATIGKIGRLWSKAEMYLNQRVAKLSAIKGTDKDFIYYAISGCNFQRFIQNHIDSNSVQANISTTTIAKFPLLLPPLPTQRAIAATLSCLDDKIELNNRINANLEAQAQAIFKSWFVDFEPFKKGDFVESELGRIPKGWRVGILSDLVNVKYGKAHQTLAGGVFPVYGSGGLMRYVEKFIYDKESVLIPRKGTLNNVMYIKEPFWTVDTMFYTEMKKPDISAFIYQFIKQKDLVSMNAGTAVPSMTTQILNALIVLIPADDVLQDYADITGSFYNQIFFNERQSRTLAAIRDALLPKLMSGELEVAK